MKNKLNKIASDTNIALKNFINKQDYSSLVPTMKYGLFPGGKKIRSKILIDIGSLLSVNYETLIKIGAAVEPPETYSERWDTAAPHNKTEPTTGPSSVSINPVKEVLNLESE